MAKKRLLTSIFLLIFFAIIAICFSRIKNRVDGLKDKDVLEKETLVGEETEILKKKDVEVKKSDNEKADCVDDVRKKNINPYFFSDSITVVEYDIKFDFETNGKEILNTAKLYIYKEKVLYDGTLYSMIVKYDESQTDKNVMQEKEDINLGHFYVQKDKIYLIQDIEIAMGLSEIELIENGRVICQSESRKESRKESEESGWHEDIKIVDDTCIFQRYNNLKESKFDGSYEYFIWEKGKGLTGYRRGHGECEEIYLQMKGTEKINSIEVERINPYFFPTGTTTVKYEGYFHFNEFDMEKEKVDREVMYTGEVTLNIREEIVFKNGILYNMYLSDNGEFYFEGNDWGENNRGYLNLGYFYVQEDKIYKLYLNYFIPEKKLKDDITEKELLESGAAKIVCQSEPRHTGEGENVWPRYWYDYIDIIGDRCEFYGEDANTNAFTESFKWQKGFGLVEYRRGTGYDDDDIIIYFH